MTTTDLKPCPFCGQVRTRFTTEPSTDGVGKYMRLECIDCRSGTMPLHFYEDDPELREHLRDRWNKRAQVEQAKVSAPAAMTDERAALEEADALTVRLEDYFDGADMFGWARVREKIRALLSAQPPTPGGDEHREKNFENFVLLTHSLEKIALRQVKDPEQAAIEVLTDIGYWECATANNQPAPPVGDGDEWKRMLDLSEQESIAEALQAFSHDSTEDNAVCLVREIVRKAIAAQPAAVPAEYFIDVSSPDEPPHYQQVARIYRESPDVIALYAAPTPPVIGMPGAPDVVQEPAKVDVHQVTLKTRKEMSRTIPSDRMGWWYDVCPGQHMTLRNATAADLTRCSLKTGSDRTPENYLCELPENGSLIHRDAIQHCRTFSIATPPAAASVVADARDAERLDFVTGRQAFICATTTDAGTIAYQLMEQDEDEEFHILSGKDAFFPTHRAAIDAAIAAQAKEAK